MKKKISTLLTSAPLVALSTTVIAFPPNNELNMISDSIHGGQQYDIATFPWGQLEIMSINATNCFIVKSGNNDFHIYANGSITIDLQGMNDYVLKTITFDEYDPIPIGGNWYRQDIDDVNMTSEVSLGIEGGSITGASGVIHMVTLFDAEVRLYSNEGVEETSWLSKVSQRQTLGDNKVYKVFFSRGDFWFDWEKGDEYVSAELYAADDNYNKLSKISDIVNGETKTIISKTVFESHFILEFKNSLDDIQDCLICAQNLNLGTPKNPFKNFWYSFNGETDPIQDNDGAHLWAKVRNYDPKKYSDVYLQQMDDITINKLILISTNWPMPDILPSKITIIGGVTNIESISGYGYIAERPFSVQVNPLGADINVFWQITYKGKPDIAPNFIYINQGGYLCLKANTWEVYPEGQDFDIIAISTRNNIVSENVVTVNIKITGTPQPRITGITLNNLPDDLYLQPTQTYVSAVPITAIVSSDGNPVPQDVRWTLSTTSKNGIPDVISIDQDGFLIINENDLDDYQIAIQIVATSVYNDSYFAKSLPFTIYISIKPWQPNKPNYALVIFLFIFGVILFLASAFTWWRRYVVRKKRQRAETKYAMMFNDGKPIKTEEKKEKVIFKETPKKSKNLLRRFVDWITFKDLRKDKKETEKS